MRHTVFTGGWQDGYVDPVFRMANSLPNMRGVVGPWGHNWADIATAGKVGRVKQ